jgi:hypothetical protein
LLSLFRVRLLYLPALFLYTRVTKFADTGNGEPFEARFRALNFPSCSLIIRAASAF